MTITSALVNEKQSVPCSSEAFVMLLIENGHPRYVKYCAALTGSGHKKSKVFSRKKEVQEGDEEDNLQGKFTSQFAGQVPWGGWSNAGLIRYKELHQLCVTARDKAESQALEREWLGRARVAHGKPFAVPRADAANGAPVAQVAAAAVAPVVLDDIDFGEE